MASGALAEAQCVFHIHHGPKDKRVVSAGRLLRRARSMVAAADHDDGDDGADRAGGSGGNEGDGTADDSMDNPDASWLM